MNNESQKINPTQTRTKPSRDIRIIATIVFLVSWSALSLWLSFLHWLIPLYTAILISPILTCIVLRVKRIQTDGFHLMPRAVGKSLYGWTSITFISLIILLYSFELWRGKWAYSRLKNEVESKGGLLKISSVTPPPIPDERNLCAIPLLASLINSEFALSNSPSEELARVTAIKLPKRKPAPDNRWLWNQKTDFDAWLKKIHGNPNTFNITLTNESAPKQILAALEAFDSQLQDLHEAADTRPDARWKLPFERGWYVITVNRHYALNNITEVLNLRSSANLATLNSQAAAKDIFLALRLANSLKSEPSFNTARQRNDLLLKTIQPVWEGLSSRQWTDPQLKQFQSQFSEIDLLDDAKLLRHSAALLQMDFWDKIDETSSLKFLISNYRDIITNHQESISLTSIIWLPLPRGWIYQNKVYTYQLFQSSGASKMRDKAPIDPLNALLVQPGLRPLLEALYEQFPQIHRTLQQAVVACALERYWLANKNYPEELEALVPKWLPAIPRMADSTAPLLAYRKTSDDRYLLYPPAVIEPSETYPVSEGDLLVGNRYRDFVWRYPTGASAKH